jgi:polysaccharide deacetylase family protein (PEP-CTERM system associated)
LDCPYTIRPLQLNTSRSTVVNALTVDVEDWYQSTYDLDAPISDRVAPNTRALLQLFDECNVRATFFVLGLVCEKHPQLIGEIKAAGHELATHGYSHRPLNGMSRSAFAEDLRRSLDLIQGVTGEPILGFRAPDFSIDTHSLWALEVLAENGIRYDSSIFPIRSSRYGIEGWYRFPHRIEMDDSRAIIEFPLSTLSPGGYAVPFVGGGYSRLLPAWLIEFGIRRINQTGQSAIVYLHPNDIDTEEMIELRHKVPLRTRLSQGFNRHTIVSLMRRLLRTLEFSTVRSVLELE